MRGLFNLECFLVLFWHIPFRTLWPNADEENLHPSGRVSVLLLLLTSLKALLCNQLSSIV